jgi:alpha-D-xyloside xylohydrolase
VENFLLQPPATPEQRDQQLLVRAYGNEVVRVTLALAGQPPGDDSVMLEWDRSLRPVRLVVKQTATGWEARDGRGRVRARVTNVELPTKHWSDLMPPPPPSFRFEVLPDGKTGVPFMAWDSFFPSSPDSLPLSYVERAGQPHRVAWSLHAAPGEKFAGTGERFARMNLAGQTLVLENADALGVNNRRAYKNVPFYVSSRPYGLLVLTSAHVRLSLADISTRAAQGLVEDDTLDLWFIGGGSLERILFNYRRLTGFPRPVPVWSFGTWMSRMSYWTAAETTAVARRMRAEKLPCDVIHLDTGWFAKDWKCDWEFSREKYPDPAEYFRQMRANGFRVSLWQMPRIGQDTKWFAPALAKGWIGKPRTTAAGAAGSNFSQPDYQGTIDFTNPAAERWYTGLIERLLKLGAAAIKTDFGEEIDLHARYHGLPAARLHNLYALLYQRAVWETTQRTTGEGIIWARAGWVGCQRYPVHWGGDCGCTWDGLAGTIRGGLHLGLSGFAFWSHDVPGFHGVPNFMNHWPADDLYVRWTQVGVFTSHLRYHGTNPREPYEYPAVTGIVRDWLKLRYALIPYIVDQAKKCCRTGRPMFRALVFHHADDARCWEIDDQYYFGDAFLVAPVLNSAGIRDVYLPAGEWLDFWTGQRHHGPVTLREVKMPLERMPIYVVAGSRVRIYPEPVQCTDEMNLRKAVTITFDRHYRRLKLP